MNASTIVNGTRPPSYFRSPSTQLGWTMGLIQYLSYAVVHHRYDNVALIGVSLFVAFFVPYFSRLSNWIDEKLNLATAKVTAGRLGRFALGFTFNIAVFTLFTQYGVFPSQNLQSIGGVLGVSLLTTCASQGIQYIALALANRDIGERHRNVIVGLSINILVTAFATLGLAWVKMFFTTLGLSFGALIFLVGIFSDLRSRFYPRHGVAVFLGTFNPVHKTHLALIRRAIEERGLEKVYIHATVVPKLHADAIRRGEIRIADREDGMRVYEKTQKADVHMNYFPTGRRFFEYETRHRLLLLAIQESGLGEKVEVLSFPELYERDGFYGVLRKVKRLASGRPLHGIHGSDLGGMTVRNIYDESGWIYPLAVVRRDQVSATAIRNGVRGLTTELIETVLEHLKAEVGDFELHGTRYSVTDGVLQPLGKQN